MAGIVIVLMILDNPNEFYVPFSYETVQEGYRYKDILLYFSLFFIFLNPIIFLILILIQKKINGTE